MQLFQADIQVTWDKYGFTNTQLILAENMNQAVKKARKIVRDKNKLYPQETLYKVESVRTPVSINEKGKWYYLIVKESRSKGLKQFSRRKTQ